MNSTALAHRKGLRFIAGLSECSPVMNARFHDYQPSDSDHRESGSSEAEVPPEPEQQHRTDHQDPESPLEHPGSACQMRIGHRQEWSASHKSLERIPVADKAITTRVTIGFELDQKIEQASQSSA